MYADSSLVLKCRVFSERFNRVIKVEEENGGE